MKKQEFYNYKKPRKLLDQVRNIMRLKHYAFRTECTYISWIKRFILFHKQNPLPFCPSFRPLLRIRLILNAHKQYFLTFY